VITGNAARLVELAEILDNPAKAAELISKMLNMSDSEGYGFNGHKHYSDYVAEQVGGIEVGRERMCCSWNKPISVFRATLIQVGGRAIKYETRVDKLDRNKENNSIIFVKRVL
jgi:hypothetical protein